jgi:hypothetical protein
MVSERNNVKFPMWRKKMDASMIVKKNTYIPDWVIDNLWKIRETFTHSTKNNIQSEVDIQYNNPRGKPSMHDGWVTTTRYQDKRNDLMRLYFDNDVKKLFKRDFFMTYRRTLERTLRDWNSSKAEKEIPFWELIDIEYDDEDCTFILTPHYNLSDANPSKFFTDVELDDDKKEMFSKEREIEQKVSDTLSSAKVATAMPYRDSKPRESKMMAVDILLLRKGGSAKRFKWNKMPDGRKIHIKYSKWYVEHDYFWYVITPKSLEIAQRERIDAFGFITGVEGCVIVDMKTLLTYVTEAGTSVHEEDKSEIRHFHLFINRDMKLIYGHTKESIFNSEFVHFD